MVVRAPQKSGRKTRDRRVSSFGKSYNVPLTAVTQIRQSSNPVNVMKISGTDRIGGVTFGPTTPLNRAIQFKMSPAHLGGTRINSLSKSFQLYRFTNMKLTVFSNLPSTSGGGYTVGYCENPDQSFTSGPGLGSQIFALTDAVIGNMFVPTTSKARINDKSKWYRIDEDSSEVMNTTQGSFVLSVDSLTAITTPLTVPVMLEYSIEFKGSAIQNELQSGQPFIFPACSGSASGIVVSMNPLPGEPSLVPMVSGSPYLINPGLTIDGASVEFMSYIDNSGFRLYESYDAWKQDSALSITTNFDTPRTTIQLYNTN